jgi:hypothetical protein
MWNHIRISGISCPTRHIRGMFTFHSVIFKSYSTAVYFSNVSEGSFGHLVRGSHFPSPVGVQEGTEMVSGATYVARRNEEMTSMSLKKRKHTAN